MSVYASLAVGARVESRAIQGSVTRYNELTGKPYEKPVEEEQYFFVGTGIGINILDYGEKSSLITAVPHYDDCNSNRVSFIGGNIVGLVLVQMSEKTEVEIAKIPTPNIQTAIEIVAEVLRETFGYIGEVNVFLVKELSC